jgi:hypothetical protein
MVDNIGENCRWSLWIKHSEPVLITS